MTNITDIKDAYRKLLTRGDPRVEDWFMMSSPWPSFVICLLYFVIVWMGPTIMANRKPIEMRNILFVYNMVLVGMSGYCFYEFIFSGWLAGYSLGCQPVDYSRSPQAMRMVKVSWWFFISKGIELLDTVIFIMRKKFKQVTFLHVFHHGIMFFSIWFGVKFVPGGFGSFQAMINAFVHTVMYTYYGLAALGPKYQKYLWWKKYLTKLQMIQFILVIIHATQLLFIDCDYPKICVYAILVYAVIFITLFANFYTQAYRKSRSDSGKVSNGIASNGIASNGIKHKEQ